jgi:carboxypeptidase PM20D1
MNTEERRQAYTAALQRMIQIETVSDPDRRSPQENFNAFRALLKELFPDVFTACEVMEFDGSLLLRWPGADPQALPVLFMNHQDVVPATAEGWQHAPFSGDITEGRLWGRGTLDDKGGLWAMLQAADELIREGSVPARDVWFESGCDEEVHGRGAETISAWLQEQGVRFEMVFDEGGDVVRDPIAGAKGLFAMIGVGEKSVVDLKFTARSEGGHASVPEKNTPLVRLGKFMSYVDRNQIFDVKLSPAIEEMLARIGPYMGKAGKVVENAGKLKKPVALLRPKLGGMIGALLSTTIAFTQAGGGEAINSIPREVWVMADMRCSHHQGQEDSIAAIAKIAKRYGVETEIVEKEAASGLADCKGKAFALVEEAVRQTIPGVDACVPYVMTGASDSRYFDKLCSQCIRFLPFTIESEQLESIHGIDEWVALDTLVPAVDYYRYLMTHL